MLFSSNNTRLVNQHDNPHISECLFLNKAGRHSSVGPALSSDHQRPCLVAPLLALAPKRWMGLGVYCHCLSKCCLTFPSLESTSMSTEINTSSDAFRRFIYEAMASFCQTITRCGFCPEEPHLFLRVQSVFSLTLLFSLCTFVDRFPSSTSTSSF